MKGLNKNNGFLKLLFLTTVLFFCINSSFAQPILPQRSLTVTATQAIQFGTLCVGSSGGTITVNWNGSKSSTGDVIPLSMAPAAQPAIFEIILCQGRNVIITFSPTATLTNGTGGSLTLHIGPTEQGISGASFTTNSDCNFITPLRVGGMLDIPGNAPPGTYTGSFDITFNQE